MLLLCRPSLRQDVGIYTYYCSFVASLYSTHFKCQVDTKSKERQRSGRKPVGYWITLTENPQFNIARPMNTETQSFTKIFRPRCLHLVIALFLHCFFRAYTSPYSTVLVDSVFHAAIESMLSIAIFSL